MPNRIILLNNKPVIARFVGDKQVYGHMGSFWIQRTAETAQYISSTKNLILGLDKELPETSATIGAITFLGKTFKPLSSAYYKESQEAGSVKTSFTKRLDVYASRYNSVSNGWLDFFKANIPILIRLDSVVRLIGLTISPYGPRQFKAKYGQQLQGAKGIWCNGEIILFDKVQSIYNVYYLVTVQSEYLTAYERILSRGNLNDMKCFLILDEVRV